MEVDIGVVAPLLVLDARNDELMTAEIIIVTLTDGCPKRRRFKKKIFICSVHFSRF